jgi:hypothetical protein
MAFDLSTILGGNVGELFTKIVGVFKVPPEKALEFQTLKETHAIELEKMQIDLEARTQEAITREVEAASANIRAEAATGDKYTSRARPTFLYLIYVILMCNYIVFPLLNRPVLTFPESLFWLFGSGYLGYSGARSWDKYSKVIQGGK